MRATTDHSRHPSRRPVRRPAAELAALLSVLPLLQHIWCVLWSVTAHPQEELCWGGHAEGVPGPLLSRGETGQGEFTSELTQRVQNLWITTLRCVSHFRVKGQWHRPLLGMVHSKNWILLLICNLYFFNVFVFLNHCLFPAADIPDYIPHSTPIISSGSKCNTSNQITQGKANRNNNSR